MDRLSGLRRPYASMRAGYEVAIQDIAADIGCRKLNYAIWEHLEECAVMITGAEQKRLRKLSEDGCTILGLMQSLKAAGCQPRLAGIQEKAGIANSEYETMVMSLVRPLGMETERFFQLASEQ